MLTPDEEETKVTCPACGKGMLEPSLARVVKKVVDAARASSEPPQVVTEMLPAGLPEKK